MNNPQHNPASDPAATSPRDTKPVQGACVTDSRAMPQRSWVCGYAELGKCCNAGPSHDGRCGRLRAAAHQQDRVNTSDSRLADGSTAVEDDQLPPCIPRRSHTWRRHTLRVNLAILTGGLLLLFMALPSRESTFVPGELSSKHAQILSNTLVSQRCGLCHPASHAEDPPARAGKLVLDAMAGAAGRLIRNDGRQDALCMKCHTSHMPMAAERNPHDLTAAMWRELETQNSTHAWQLVSSRSAEERDTLVDPSSNHSQESLGQTSCAMCHNEHHGRGFDLKLISDHRCQACHRKQFESLASGHPEFKNFPMDRPRGLAFSHARHADDHFPKKSRDFDCKSCHVDGQQGGAYGSVTRSLTFERACASCHEQSIRAASVEGWAVVQLPSIEAAAATPGSGLERWPSTARFGFEGTISPVMRGLLLADANVTTILQQLPNDGNLVDVSTISSEREQAAIALALATERLIDETARDGQQAWLKRLERITREKLGRPLFDNERALLVAMCAGLPPDVFRQVQQAWFEQASPTAVAKAANAPQATNSNKVNNSSRANDLPSAAPQTNALTLEMPDSLLAAPLSGDADLLSASGSDTSGSDTSGSDALGSDLLAGANIELNELGQSTARPAGQAERAPPIKGVTHAVAGGWYVDHETLAIRYMPSGHADATLAAWSTWWTLMTREDGQPATVQTDRLVRVVRGVEADEKSVAAHIPGGCVQCHSLRPAQFSPEVGARAGLLAKQHVAPEAMTSDSFTADSFTSDTTTNNYTLSSQAARALAESWRVPTRARTDKEFTKFNHTPHLALPAINDCRYCHKLNNSEKSDQANLAGKTNLAATGTSVPGTGRLVSTWQLSDLHVRQTHSEFSAMHLGQCTACHRPGGANDGCLQCHNYHINVH